MTIEATSKEGVQGYIKSLELPQNQGLGSRMILLSFGEEQYTTKEPHPKG